MAENKKSFVLYADLLHTVDKMPSNKAGELFKHILEYVNDKDPQTEDLIIQLTFEPIKQQLKRDLRKYESKLLQWSEAGKRSAEVRKVKKDERTLTDVESRSTVSTVNDSVNDSVNVNDIKKTKVFSFSKSLIELGAEKELVSDFLKVRKTKRLTNTKTAFDNFLGEVKKSNKSINEVLTKCCEKSWGGFEAEWINGKIIEETALIGKNGFKF